MTVRIENPRKNVNPPLPPPALVPLDITAERPRIGLLWGKTGQKNSTFNLEDYVKFPRLRKFNLKLSRIDAVSLKRTDHQISPIDFYRFLVDIILKKHFSPVLPLSQLDITTLSLEATGSAISTMTPPISYGLLNITTLHKSKSLLDSAIWGIRQTAAYPPENSIIFPPYFLPPYEYLPWRELTISSIVGKTEGNKRRLRCRLLHTSGGFAKNSKKQCFSIQIKVFRGLGSHQKGLFALHNVLYIMFIRIVTRRFRHESA